MEMPLRRPLQKLAASAALLVLLILTGVLVDAEAIVSVVLLLTLFIALPLFILYGIEAGRAIRSTENVPPTLRVIGVLLSLPQAILGLISLFLGLALVLWVAYNFLIERQPQFDGGVLPSLGIGPALIVAGYWWLRSAFRKGGTHGGT
jgi:hypothetical protein